MKLDSNLDFYANQTLAHYLRIVFEATGKKWDSDSDDEIRKIFEQIQSFVEYEVDKRCKELIDERLHLRAKEAKNDKKID